METMPMQSRGFRLHLVNDLDNYSVVLVNINRGAGVLPVNEKGVLALLFGNVEGRHAGFWMLPWEKRRSVELDRWTHEINNPFFDCERVLDDGRLGQRSQKAD
jgi:hypothetical protein